MYTCNCIMCSMIKEGYLINNVFLVLWYAKSCIRYFIFQSDLGDIIFAIHRESPRHSRIFLKWYVRFIIWSNLSYNSQYYFQSHRNKLIGCNSSKCVNCCNQFCIQVCHIHYLFRCHIAYKLRKTKYFNYYTNNNDKIISNNNNKY